MIKVAISNGDLKFKAISRGFDDTTAPPNVIEGLVNHSRNLRTVEGAIWPRNWYVNLILKSKSCFAWVNDGELTRQATKKGDAPSLNSNCTVKRCAERHATLSAEDPSAPIWSCTWIKGHWGRWPLMFKMVEADTVTNEMHNAISRPCKISAALQGGF